MRLHGPFGLAATVVLILHGATALHAQGTAATGLIDGRVRSGPTQQPIANATVRVGWHRAGGRER